MIRGLFIDRDGTINVDKGHVFKREEFEYIPGALAALKKASESKIKIFIVTNQAGIAKGLYTEQDFADLTVFMLEQMREQGVQVADVLYCPHHPEGIIEAYRQVCACRKPGVALLQGVIDRDGFLPDELALIGDKNSDIEAGRALGLKTYLVETGYGMVEKRSTNADYVVRDLWVAVRHLLSHDGI